MSTGFESTMKSNQVGGSLGGGFDMFSVETSFNFGQASQDSHANMQVKCDSRTHYTEYQTGVNQIFRHIRETYTTSFNGKSDSAVMEKRIWADVDDAGAKGRPCKLDHRKLENLAKDYVAFTYNGTGEIDPANVYKEISCFPLSE